MLLPASPDGGFHDVEWRTLTALCTSPREARFPDVSIGLGEGPAARVWATGERRASLRRPALNLSNGQFRIQSWSGWRSWNSHAHHANHKPSRKVPPATAAIPLIVASAAPSLIASHRLFWKVAWRPVTDAPSGYYGRVLNIARLRLLQRSGQPLSHRFDPSG